jgi:hypothetical protein
MNAAAWACAGLLAAWAPAVAQPVQRCAHADGRITYANGPCPPGSTVVRTLPPAESPSAADRQAAQERARQDGRAAAEIDRRRKADEARAAREQEQALAQAKKKEAHCRRLQSRLRSAQEELAEAPLNKRAEPQRRVKRAEQLYNEDCGPQTK